MISSKESQTDLSILVITHGRAQSCRLCLESLLCATAAVSGYRCEIMIAINGPDAVTSKMVRELTTDSVVKILEFPERLTPAAARNRILEKSSGQWIFFIDDDAFVEDRFFSAFFAALTQFPEAVAIGGPNLNPRESSLFQEVTGLTLSSPFATSFSSVRYKAWGEPRTCGEESLILCNLFLKKRNLPCDPFPEDLVCCEENWVLDQLQRAGHKLIHDPSLKVLHERRSDILSFGRQVFKYGFGRGQFLRRRRAQMSPLYLLPTMCLFYATGVSVFVAGGVSFSYYWMTPFMIYPIFCAVASLISAWKVDRPLAKAIMSLGLFPLVHISYGWGFLRGVFRG